MHTEFIQPTITCNGPRFNLTSHWVGLDGFNSNTVEQDGTFASCGGPDHMTPPYFAWHELSPAAAINVFPVKPGDVIDATVSFAHNKFTLTVSDVSSGKSATTAASCAECQRSSAEWIVERPALRNSDASQCFITEMANFHIATFTNAVARVDGGQVKPVSGFTNIPIDAMQRRNNGRIAILAQTDSLSPDGTTFDVVRQRHGRIVPIQL